MKTLFVIYILMNGLWYPGDMINGWGSINYETEEICLERKQRAEELHIKLMLREPHSAEKKFECVDPVTR